MSTTTLEPVVDGYIRRLRKAARGLPHASRDELVQQIQEHLDEALPPGSSEADARNAVERLGDPEAIVAEEFERLGIRPARAGKLEWAVVLLLPLGGIPFPFGGWLVGVILLWASRVWTTREKLVGTLVPPGGLSAVFILLAVGGSTCTSGGGPARVVTVPTRGQAPHVARVVEHCTSSGLPSSIAIALAIAFVIAGIATPIFLARRASASRI